MKPRRSSRRNRALTLTEVLVVIAVLVLLAAVLLPRLIAANRRPGMVSCAGTIGRIIIYYQEWANDHGGKFPMEVSVADGGTKELIATGDVISSFQVISNELVDPRLLHCMSDTNRTGYQFSSGRRHPDLVPAYFSTGLKNHISYFVGLDASANRPNALLTGDDNFEIGGVAVKPGLLELSANSPLGWTSARHMTGKRLFWNATTSFGYIGLVDGSIQTATVSSRTNLLVGLAPSCVYSFTSLLQQTDLATNRIAIP